MFWQRLFAGIKASSKEILSYPKQIKASADHFTANTNGAQRVNRSVGDLRAKSTNIWGWLHAMQIATQRTCPAWPQKSKLRRTLDCSRITKEMQKLKC